MISKDMINKLTNMNKLIFEMQTAAAAYTAAVKVETLAAISSCGIDTAELCDAVIARQKAEAAYEAACAKYQSYQL